MRTKSKAMIEMKRTAGWFTTVFPMSLSVAGASTPTEALQRIQAQQLITQRGIGYGVLRYLSPRAEIR